MDLQKYWNDFYIYIIATVVVILTIFLILLQNRRREGYLASQSSKDQANLHDIKFENEFELDEKLFLKVPCFGQQYGFGMLYDCHRDQIVNDLKIWKDGFINYNKKTLPLAGIKKQHDAFILDDTACLIPKSVDADENTTLSILCELIKSKDKNYQLLKSLQHKTSQHKYARVFLKYSKITKSVLIKTYSLKEFDQAILASLQNGQTKATHIIVKVQEEREFLFIFEKEITEEDEYDDTCKEIRLLVKQIKDLANNGTLPSLNNQQARLSEVLECKICLSDTQTCERIEFSEIINFVCHEREKTDDEKSGKPMFIWLYPLASLLGPSVKIPAIHEVESKLAERTIQIFCELYNLKKRAAHFTSHQICYMLSQLEKVKEKLEDIEKKLVNELAELIPRIRKKQSKPKEKLKNLQRHYLRNFKTMNNWLDDKKEEVKWLYKYLSSLEDIPERNNFLLNQTDPPDQPPSNTMCLEFKILTKSDSFLDSLDKFSESDLSDSFQQEQWYKKSVLRENIKKVIDNFNELVHLKKENTKLTITCKSNDIVPGDNGAIITFLKGTKVQEFEFPPKLDEPPSPTMYTWEKIELEWDVLNTEKNSPIGYKILYKSDDEDENWMSCPFEDNSGTLYNLKPNTKYNFKVQAEYELFYGPESEVGVCKTIKTPLAIRIRDSFSSKEDSQKIFKLHVNKVTKKSIVTCTFGEFSEHKETKLIMLAGAKNNNRILINGIVHYMLGVEREYDIVFKLTCDDEFEQDSMLIFVYNISFQEDSPVPFNVTIIDTPTFDCKQKNLEIEQKLKELLSHKKELHCVAFVAQRSVVADFPQPEFFALNSLREIFAKDAFNNIWTVVLDLNGNMNNQTFCNFCFPYVQFSNDTTNSQWDELLKQYEAFFAQLTKTKPFSLQLTCEVLNKREELRSWIGDAQQSITDGLSKVNDLSKQNTELLSSRATKLVYESKIRIRSNKQSIKNEKDGGSKTFVNCKVCKATCDFLGNASNIEIYNCPAMDGKGEQNAKCRLCKCEWKEHEKTDCCISYFEEEEQIKSVLQTKEQIQYENAINNEKAANEKVKKLKEEIGQITKTVQEKTEQIQGHIVSLQEVTLQPSALSTEMLIKLNKSLQSLLQLQADSDN
jgi:hypothetical protein